MQYCASVESFGCEKLHGGGVSKERRLCHFILRFFIASYQSPKICKAHYTILILMLLQVLNWTVHLHHTMILLFMK